MSSDRELSDFLRSVEKRAFKRAVYSVRDDEAALDIVQDAMIKLSERYSDRPAAEWPMLFQRILSNTMMDWFRHQKVRNAVMHNFTDFETDDNEGDFDFLASFDNLESSEGTESSADALERTQTRAAIEDELTKLPSRQREAFLMRYWEEMDVAETAQTMGCSEGSVKTHCSRAVHALAKALKLRGITL